MAWNDKKNELPSADKNSEKHFKQKEVNYNRDGNVCEPTNNELFSIVSRGFITFFIGD